MTRADIEKIRGSFEKSRAKYGDCVITGYGILAAVATMVRPKRKRKSNNWLKMHGYPMRRKKRRRKRS